MPLAALTPHSLCGNFTGQVLSPPVGDEGKARLSACLRWPRVCPSRAQDSNQGSALGLAAHRSSVVSFSGSQLSQEEVFKDHVKKPHGMFTKIMTNCSHKRTLCVCVCPPPSRRTHYCLGRGLLQLAGDLDLVPVGFVVGALSL